MRRIVRPNSASQTSPLPHTAATSLVAADGAFVALEQVGQETRLFKSVYCFRTPFSIVSEVASRSSQHRALVAECHLCSQRLVQNPALAYAARS